MIHVKGRLLLVADLYIPGVERLFIVLFLLGGQQGLVINKFIVLRLVPLSKKKKKNQILLVIHSFEVSPF